MPTVQPGSKVLVTGANGYIAFWVVRTLLERGYSVRGTVRSASKGEYLKKTFESYGDKFELAVVEDITKDGAFDEAVKGVDAIEHTASPFHFNADDPEELIGPAVKGTVGILQSALKYGSGVKRVVVTSSCAAVLHLDPNPITFSELDWNEQSIQEVEKLGKGATAAAKYRASKTLAERAAWEFWNKNKGSVNWDLVVLNPPFVFGPLIHDIPSPKDINTSALEWFKTITDPERGGKSTDALFTFTSSWVDVRDLATAHAVSLVKAEAGGERIIISAGPFVWQDWIDTALALTPSPIPSRTLPRGDPNAVGRERVYSVKYDTSKEQKLLGLTYKTKEETARDTLADFEARGW